MNEVVSNNNEINSDTSDTTNPDLFTLSLSAKQLEAIELCCNLSPTHHIVAVSGQAGTGKTSILRYVYKKLTRHGYKVVLCAFTGKATKRITEATGIPATTIHRLLEFTRPGQPDLETGKVAEISFPRRNNENVLDCDVVLVDESAMLPVGLYRALLDALGQGTVIRFFGDINQLQPIEEIATHNQISSFQRLIDDKYIKSIKLTEIFRQGNDSNITFNGDRIIRGLPPVPKSDFGIKISETPINKLSFICRTLLNENKTSFETISHQIITPARNGKAGSLILNKILAELYMPIYDTSKCATVPRHIYETKRTGEPSVTFYVGQKVIINQNMYDLRQTISERYINDVFIPPGIHETVFNGETGIIIDIIENDYLIIDLGDRTVSIPPWLEYQDPKNNNLIHTIDPRRDIEHGYAISTHKAQGSEYTGVIYFLSASAPGNQCRANTYTGITRAKSVVCMVADNQSFGYLSLRRDAPVWNKK